MTRPNTGDESRLPSGAAPLPNPEEVNEFHRYSDVDNAPESHHHTLGVDPNQASYGDHNHDGRNSKFITAVVGKANDSDKLDGLDSTAYVKHIEHTDAAVTDPHPMYLTAAEGDALFLTQTEGDARYVNMANFAGGTLSTDPNDFPLGASFFSAASTDPGLPVAGMASTILTVKTGPLRIWQIIVQADSSPDNNDPMWWRTGYNDSTTGTGITTEWGSWQQVLTPVVSDTLYLGLTAKAADSNLLDGFDSATAATANTIALRDAAGALTVGTPTAVGHATTKTYVDTNFLLKTGKAADSELLDGIDSAGFATASHTHSGTTTEVEELKAQLAMTVAP